MSLKSYINNTADAVYSQYVRIKEADINGYCTCVTCGKIGKWNDDMDAGHYVERDRWATRFNDSNVHPQCASCNRFKGGRKAQYTLYLTNRYKRGIIEKLVRESQKVKTFTLDELKLWVKEWREEILKMKITKNI